MKRFYNGEIALGFVLGCVTLLSAGALATLLGAPEGHWLSLPTSARVLDALNSVFITSVAGALAGAFFGAYAAQRIAERSKYRDELHREFRKTAAAISLTFHITNTVISFKKQYIKPMKQAFDEQKARIITQFALKASAPHDRQFIIHHIADFKTLSVMALPIDLLQEHCFADVSLETKPLAIVSSLNGAIDSLNKTIESRNKLIDSVKMSGLTGEQLLYWYFGLEYNPGSFNKEYPDTFEAIYLFTDDVIYFCHQLSEALVRHAKEIKQTFDKRFGRSTLAVSSPSFRIAEEAGLMPDPAKYADWSSAFVTAKKAKS
jgi:hypothetical protein